jgi:hypothetical protein
LLELVFCLVGDPRSLNELFYSELLHQSATGKVGKNSFNAITNKGDRNPGSLLEVLLSLGGATDGMSRLKMPSNTNYQ